MTRQLVLQERESVPALDDDRTSFQALRHLPALVRRLAWHLALQKVLTPWT